MVPSRIEGGATLNSLEQPNFALLSTHPEWRTTWTHIVGGQFSASPYSSLLFYEQSTGHAEFYETDGQGGMNLLRQYDDWRSSWTLIIPGFFRKPGFLPENRQHTDTGFPAHTGFLLYDQQAGFGAFYDTDGKGGIVKLAEYGDWRTTWTHIVAGMFTNSPFSGLLFYDQTNGYAEMYATDGSGGMTLITSYSPWPTFWTHIVPGEFFNCGAVSAQPITDLFFYDAVNRFGATYGCDGQGRLIPVGSQQNLPAATIIIPGSFGGGAFTNLLFYQRRPTVVSQSPASARVAGFGLTGGTASFQQLAYNTFGSVCDASVTPPQPANAVWSSFEDHSDWSPNWDAIVPGNFWMADPDDVYFPDGGFTDLVFYERDRGYGEFYLHEPPSPTILEPLAGYASAHTVRPGETLYFYVASQVGPYSIRVYRVGMQETPMVDVPTTPADPLPIPRLGYRDGAGWPPVASLTISGDWPSGLYLARVYIPSTVRPGLGGGVFTQEVKSRLQPAVPPLDIPFVVRAADPGQGARILVVIPDNTYEAYNFWGGRSLYGYAHNNGQLEWAYPQTASFIPYSFRVSFLRPFMSFGAKKWQDQEVPLIQWLERQAIRVEMCCASDLDDPDALNFLGRYKLVVTVGHSEYWSGNMKHNLQQFIDQGGNAAFLGGNICYWQVRFQDDPELGRSMICYKLAPSASCGALTSVAAQRQCACSKTFDPSSPKTVLWSCFADDPDTELTGVSYEWTTYPDPEFQVQQPDHWVFANTGLGLNDVFGRYDNGQQTVVGPETDHTQPTTPPGFQLLARVLSDGSEVASMGILTPGGTVVTAATIDWSLGLNQDGSWNPVDQITRNVLIRLG